MSAAPFVSHQRVSRNLMIHLHRHFDLTGMGEVLHAPVAVVLSQSDVVEPDLVVVLAEHASRIRRERIEGAPDLVVEILSPSTAYRDRGLKLDLYQKAGVSEYWMVDPERKVVQQYGPPRHHSADGRKPAPDRCCLHRPTRCTPVRGHLQKSGRRAEPYEASASASVIALCRIMSR